MSRSEPGFTLIELLVVLAIMAAATTLFMTYLRTGTNGGELRAATSEMKGALGQTRSLAITGNRVTSLVIAPGARNYRDPLHQHLLSDRVRMAFQRLVPQGEDERAGAVFFFPDGSSSGGEIDFAAGDAGAAVSVDWFTGLANVYARRPGTP
jgi:general secretion pathway protein H